MAEQKKFRANIGAFWLRNDKRGGHYIKGCIELEGKSHEVILFTNTFKTNAQQPDYVVREQIEGKFLNYAKDNIEL